MSMSSIVSALLSLSWRCRPSNSEFWIAAIASPLPSAWKNSTRMSKDSYKRSKNHDAFCNFEDKLTCGKVPSRLDKCDSLSCQSRPTEEEKMRETRHIPHLLCWGPRWSLLGLRPRSNQEFDQSLHEGDGCLAWPGCYLDSSWGRRWPGTFCSND